MNKSQEDYGMLQLEILALELELSIEQTIRVLDKINRLKAFYEWANAGEFIEQKLAGMKGSK